MSDLDTRDLLEKAYERLLPAIGYLHSSVAGFAASVIVFTTWLARRRLTSEERVGLELDDEYRRLIELKEKIEELERKKELLESALSKASNEFEAKRIRRQISQVSQMLENLYEEYDLVDLRVMAIKKLLETEDKKVIKNIEKIIKELKGGKYPNKLYDILQALEERWKRREMTKDVLEKIISEG
jgi:hypothetical protein